MIVYKSALVGIYQTLVSNFMKIRPVGTELFNVDGQTGRQTD